MNLQRALYVGRNATWLQTSLLDSYSRVGGQFMWKYENTKHWRNWVSPSFEIHSSFIINISRLAGQGFVICTHQCLSAFMRRPLSNQPVFRSTWKAAVWCLRNWAHLPKRIRSPYSPTLTLESCYQETPLGTCSTQKWLERRATTLRLGWQGIKFSWRTGGCYCRSDIWSSWANSLWEDGVERLYLWRFLSGV